MDTLHFVKKGKLMNSLEKFYMYKATIINNPANEKSTTRSNNIYDVEYNMTGTDVDLPRCMFSGVFIATVTPQVSAYERRSTTTV